MSSGADAQLLTIDSEMLTPLVRQALGSETVEVTDWGCQQIGGAIPGPRWVYRFTGSARDRDELIPWSLILKVMEPLPEREDPSGPQYWKREVLAYQSGILDDLPGLLAVPRCFGVVEQSGGEFWVWLEEVRDEIGPEWPLEHYGVVARHLGQFNGAYVMGRPIPSEPWLGSGWLRARRARLAASGVEQLRGLLEHPLVRRVYPPDVARTLFHLWAEREALLAALDDLPQTFYHFDAWKRNLFARHAASGRYETVAIDWGMAGRGAIGAEIVALVAASLWYREVEWARAQALDRVVFDGYIEGLGDVGWHGDPRIVRFGYGAVSALRYIGYTAGALSILVDKSRRALGAQSVGCSPEEVVDQLAKFYHFVLSLGDEARRLLDQL